MEIIRSKKKRKTVLNSKEVKNSNPKEVKGLNVEAKNALFLGDNDTVFMDLKTGDTIVDYIIIKANEIYTDLGIGHTESVYHKAMEAELREAKIKYESEVVTPIMYKNYYVGYGRADIVINRNKPNEEKDEIIVELKALSTNGFKQNEVARLKTYMKSLNIKQGIMINFPQTLSSLKCIFKLVTDNQ